jgi:hypothetical protein
MQMKVSSLNGMRTSMGRVRIRVRQGGGQQLDVVQAPLTKAEAKGSPLCL